MVTFKQFLTEVKVDGSKVLLNPKSGQEIFSELNPLDRAEFDVKGEEFIYKFIFDVKKNNLYVWWLGDLIHDDVQDKFNIKKTTYEDSPKDDDEKYSLNGYIDLKKKTLEVLFLGDPALNSKERAVKVEISNSGNFKKFVTKFRLSTTNINTTKFTRFF